jgi:hypothetical protein
MFQFMVSHLGHLVQLYVLYSIHIAVYYEITCVEEFLLMSSKYERDFNHITGWPLYILTIYYYYKCCTAHPGKVRNNWDLYCRGDRSDLQSCFKCPNLKPIRTSHCKRCDVCVAKRDHHCFFANNCIGADNYKTFVWFLVFGFLGSLHFILRGVQWQLEWYYGSRLDHYATSYGLLFGVHIYNMMGFAGLLGYIALKTFRNIVSNAATMEGWLERQCCGDSAANIFDLGLVHNWVSIVGVNPFLWFSATPPCRFSVPLGPDFAKKPDRL